jgi:hypothetical protein
MLLLIVFYLSAHVLCTVRDSSLSRLIDEGFGVADQVMARDSRGFDRVVSQFQGRQGPQVDVVPSWLLGGADGTSVEIHLGARANQDAYYDVDTLEMGYGRYDYEIEGMANWIISYTQQDAGRFSLSELAANELLGRCRHILPARVVYFSRPNPHTVSSWVYTIVDNGPRRLLLGASPVPTYRWMSETRLTLRQKSNIIEAVTDWSLLLRRHPRIRDGVDSLLTRSEVDPTQEYPEFVMVITKIPELRIHRLSIRDEDVSNVLLLVAHLIHRDEKSISRYAFRNMSRFLAHAFFSYSDSPQPVNDDSGHLYRFKSLQEVIGDEFPGYDREYIRSKFAEFVRLFRLEWDNVEPNPAAVPSMVDLIEEDQYHILK